MVLHAGNNDVCHFCNMNNALKIVQLLVTGLGAPILVSGTILLELYMCVLYFLTILLLSFLSKAYYQYPCNPYSTWGSLLYAL